MIETLMVFSLGFLVSTLLALLVIPALNERADRLSRRRVEAQLPMSIAELNAERDRLRAELAVRERRMESRVEQVLAGKAADMAQAGARAVRINILEGELDEARKRIAGLEKDLADTRAELAETSANLEATRTTLRETRETLAAREAALADLERRHEEALQDIDAKRIQIADLETRLATQTSRAEEAEKHGLEKTEALAATHAELARTQKSLAAEQDRGGVLEERSGRFAGERDAQTKRADTLEVALREATSAREALLEEVARRDNEIGAIRAAIGDLERRLGLALDAKEVLAAQHARAIRALEDERDLAKAERSSVQGALEQARAERMRLQNELAAARRSAEKRFAEENAALLARIDEVADAIMAKAAAEKAAPPPPSGSGRNGKAAGDAAKTPADSKPVRKTARSRAVASGAAQGMAKGAAKVAGKAVVGPAAKGSSQSAGERDTVRRSDRETTGAGPG